MPKGFAFPDRGADMWTPMTMGPDDLQPALFTNASGKFVGWLKPGVSADAAERQVQQD